MRRIETKEGKERNTRKKRNVSDILVIDSCCTDILEKMQESEWETERRVCINI